MNETLIASILAIAYGLVEVIKWLVKGSQKKSEKEETKEQITIMLEKLRNIEMTIAEQEKAMYEIIRILDRVTMTEAMLAEIAKETNKMVSKAIKRNNK